MEELMVKEEEKVEEETCVIVVYSRKQALEDGELVDVSQTAREAGIRFPVALTRVVYERYVVVPAGVRGQDESGRLWDILFMFRFALRSGLNRSAVCFRLSVRNDNRKAQVVHLKAVCGPGDEGEPVITISLPFELPFEE
jgi:hypothetical protein